MSQYIEAFTNLRINSIDEFFARDNVETLSEGIYVRLNGIRELFLRYHKHVRPKAGKKEPNFFYRKFVIQVGEKLAVPPDISRDDNVYEDYSVQMKVDESLEQLFFRISKLKDKGSNLSRSPQFDEDKTPVLLIAMPISVGAKEQDPIKLAGVSEDNKPIPIFADEMPTVFNIADSLFSQLQGGRIWQ